MDDGGNLHVYDIALIEGEENTTLVLAREIPVDRSVLLSLTSTYQRHKEFVEISSDFAGECDANGRFTFITPRGALGYPFSSLIGRSVSELAVDPKVPLPFMTRHTISNEIVCVYASNGSLTYLNVSARPLFQKVEHGAAQGVSAVM